MCAHPISNDVKYTYIYIIAFLMLLPTSIHTTTATNVQLIDHINITCFKNEYLTRIPVWNRKNTAGLSQCWHYSFFFFKSLSWRMILFDYLDTVSSLILPTFCSSATWKGYWWMQNITRHTAHWKLKVFCRRGQTQSFYPRGRDRMACLLARSQLTGFPFLVINPYPSLRSKAI